MYSQIVNRKFLILLVIGCIFCLGKGSVSCATEVDETQEIVEEEYGTISFGATEGRVYVWEEPSQDSNWVGKLYTDNMVNILSVEGDWALIESGTVIGYVELEHLLNEEEASIHSAEIGTLWVTVDAVALNVRKGPGYKYEIMGIVEKGTQLLVVGDNKNGWQKVQYEDSDFYVLATYVTEEVEYSYAESKEEEQRFCEYAEAMYRIKFGVMSRSIKTIDESAFDGEIDGASIVEFAMQFLGNPYVWGGTSLLYGCDCSAFVQAVYGYAGYELPRSSSSFPYVGYGVSYSDVEVGDIICYSGHVAIYLGNGKVISAAGEEKGIGISNATYTTIIAVRRIL